jgi:hypothetical protein
VVCWLTGFKALAAVWGGGPVGSVSSSGSFLQRAALLLLPLTQQQPGARSSSPSRLQLGLLLEVSLKLAAGFGVILLLHSAQMPTALRHVLYGELRSAPAVTATGAARKLLPQTSLGSVHHTCDNSALTASPAAVRCSLHCTAAVIVWLAVSLSSSTLHQRCWAGAWGCS